MMFDIAGFSCVRGKFSKIGPVYAKGFAMHCSSSSTSHSHSRALDSDFLFPRLETSAHNAHLSTFWDDAQANHTPAYCRRSTRLQDQPPVVNRAFLSLFHDAVRFIFRVTLFT